MSFNFVSYGQDIDSLKLERKEHLREGTFRALIGTFSCLIGVSQIINPIKDPDVYFPLSLFGGIGIAINCSSIPQFAKARREKKEIKKLENE